MTNFLKDLGRRGEEIAKDYLITHGYKVIEMNYDTPLGEIDIIASIGGTLVFVEVKTRRDERHGSPLEAVTPHKRRQILKVANWYVKAQRLPDCPLRVDVVGIRLFRDGRVEDIRHVENAFEG